MIIENSKMQALFSEADIARYYPTCADIALSGEDYKVRKITFFAKDEASPLSDYTQVKEYDDNFLLVGIYTEDKTLISECMEFVDGIKDNYQEIELRTPYLSVLDNTDITKRFSLEAVEYPANPIYYIHTRDELLPYVQTDGVSIALHTEEDKAEITRCAQQGLLDSECMGEGMFTLTTCFKDVKWYILRVDGNIAGYLRAECGYSNLYDIGWLYVEPRYRGKGYATALTLYFAHHIFDMGAVPHYGFAICPESVRVAEKCGFKCDKTEIHCRALKKLKSPRYNK